jgi:heat shock protein HslJ
LCTSGVYASFLTIPGAGTSWILDSSLANTEWQLVSYDNGNTLVPVATGSEITLKFNNDGSIGGSGGINLYFGPYTQTGTTITFGTLGSTEMAGPEPLMDQESTYYRLLDSVRSFHSDGNTIKLSDETGHVLLAFKAENAGNSNGSADKNPVAGLPGTEWKLSSYSDDNAVVSGQDVSTISLKFDDTGSLSGFGGVNSYFGSYNLDGNAISIGPLGSTKMAGPEPLMALEIVYFNLLDSVTGISLAGDSLSLTDNSGNVILLFGQKNKAPQGRYTALFPPGTSHTIVPPSTGEPALVVIKDRFHNAYNWSSSTTGSPTKLVRPGKGIVTIPATGTTQRPSTMPRYSDSIIPPETYPGGPQY